VDERDSLRIKNEIFQEYLQKNNITVEGSNNMNSLEL